MPTWLRAAAAAPQSLEDAAFAAAAALTTLDAVVRREEKWAGAWRQRLALSAAAATAKQGGRVEDEGALRDTFVFSGPGDSLSGSTTLGPAGLLLLAWRRLASRPAEELLTTKNLAALLEEFGYARDDESVSDLMDDLRQLAATDGTVAIMTGAIGMAERHGLGRVLGAWLADALLAQRLGWVHAVPLLGPEAALGTGAGQRRSAASFGATGIEIDPERAKNLLAAQARAALRAIDLFAELGRRADKLLAVAPKLRAKGADAIIDRLLNEDALVASRGNKIDEKMSDRGLRRLFDRLFVLGAVRELSGRPSFRIYGL
nr:DUF1403 family protein [Pseudaminobacter manganicus]